MKTSWKTTVGGLLSGVGTLFAGLFPQWANWGHLAAGAGTVIIGLSARDNGVTSEQAGAGK